MRMVGILRRQVDGLARSTALAQQPTIIVFPSCSSTAAYNNCIPERAVACGRLIRIDV
jgi:hypothetical protein